MPEIPGGKKSGEKKSPLEKMTNGEYFLSKKVTEIQGIKIPQTAYAQKAVADAISSYSTLYGKSTLSKILDSGELYRLYIRRELKKRGMPAALEYLPVVESEYKPSALSKSKATGLWQFMENSIKPFMTKNSVIDERLDPWISTDAALTKLQDNYKTFGDWPLAIAAYNCGAGAMQRILKKSPVKTFWYIAEKGLLRDESVRYVPKFLAAAELSKNGAEYGISLPEITKSERFAEFDYLIATKEITISRLASELRLDEENLRILNNALLRQKTDEKWPVRIRLPSGLGSSAFWVYCKITGTPPEFQRQIESYQKWTEYKVKKSDTIFSLAKKYSIPTEILAEFNGLSSDSKLKAGTTIAIPVKFAGSSAEN